MKYVSRSIEFINDKTVLLILLIVFLINIYGVFDDAQTYLKADDDSLIFFKPGYDTSEEAPDRSIVGNMVGWVTLVDTKVDYPIMQGEDNAEYLNKNPYGDFSLSGSIFMDYRNNPKFKDDYSLLYGHHMEGDYMFGSLDKYLNKKYFDEHSNGILYVGTKIEYKLELFAVCEFVATDSKIFSPGDYSGTEVLNYIKDNAKFYNESNEPNLDKNQRILSLSTCKSPITTERTVVFFKIGSKAKLGTYEEEFGLSE